MGIDIIKVQIPCDMKFTRVAEDMVDLIIPHLKTENIVRTTIDLRIVMNEGFTNVFKHAGQNPGQPVEVTYEIEETQLTIKIKDLGPGIKVNDHPPSYPDTLIGTEQHLVSNMDGEVKARIVDPTSIDILFYPRSIDKTHRHSLIEASRSNCMGLSIMSQLVDRISYNFNTNGSYPNELVLVKKL